MRGSHGAEQGQTRVPSGLFPAGPPRRTYREPHPVRPPAVLAGAGAGAVWLGLFALLGSDLRSHLWWVAAAGAVAWVAALALGWYGDRGVAVGLALVTGVVWAVAGGLVAASWLVTADWPLW